MADTIFTKIINGEFPSHKIYEDENTFVFLSIQPIRPGHTLVIPKKPVRFVWDLDDADYTALMATVKKVAQRIREALNVPYVGEQVVGVDVPHAHVHLVPFSHSGEFPGEPLAEEPDHAQLAEIAKKLAF